MNIFSRTGLLGLAATAALVLLSACDNKPAPLPPQVTELGCPVESGIEMQNIFRGAYGVDGVSRPLNSHGVPVDTEGNCLSTAPVPEVFSAPIAPAYVTVLQSRYHYVYAYDPVFVHVYSSPTVIYHVGARPTGKVILQTTAPANVHVTVPAGSSQTVRPGAPAATTQTTVAPGATTTVKPGAAPAATAPAAVTPPKADSPTTTFNRPAAAAPAAPAAVTPPKAAAPTTTFNRPTTKH
jgi:hypothetical protein